ncbi:MAG: hypothetical protein ACT4O9_14165 [Blastocatellia bacterium]
MTVLGEPSHPTGPTQRDSSNNLKYTTYSYNQDGSILSMTDGRGVVTNYTYNSRGLVTNIGWDVGSTGVTDPADVAFSYDNAGKRTQMTDGLGTVNYEHNSLSQMTGETRSFSDTNTGFPNNTAGLNYTYTIGGQLKSYGAEFGSNRTVTSAFDQIGRLTGATATFDGHGRLKTSHRPEQRDTSNNLKYTTYNYNPDDSISNETDARGAVTNRIYNSRGLIEQQSYAVPQGSTIPVPGNVSFQYDNVGNRTQMIDQTGTKTYQYDSLSRLTSETKQFNGQNSSPTNALTLSYQYHLGGELKSITEPFGQRIDYETDKIGRLSQVTASTPIQPTSYPAPPYLLSNVQYYAFGAVKGMSYGSGATMSQSFNNRLQVSEHKVRAVPYWAQSPPWSNLHAINMEYTYLSDGRINYSKAVTINNTDSIADRGYKYDQVGRITNATTGAEARGGIEPNAEQRPYRQNFSYDVWGNVTTRDAWQWARHENTQHLYSNNRESTWSYDNDGRLTESQRLFGTFTERFQYVFDAAGGLATNISATAPQCEDPGTTRTIWLWNDGDGQAAAKRINASNSQHPSMVEYERFFIRSSVLNQVISEVYNNGTRNVTYTYAFDTVLARQQHGFVAGWEHRDPSNAQYSNTLIDEYGGTDSGGTMFDPAGSNVGAASSSTQCNSNLFDDWWNYHFGPARRGGCYFDGVEHHCSFSMRFLLGDSAVLGPAQEWRLVRNPRSGEIGWGQFKAYANDMAGWWRDFSGPTSEGDIVRVGTDSVHIPFGSNRNAYLPSPVGSRRASVGREPVNDREERERIRDQHKNDPPPEIPCIPGTLQFGIHGTGALGPVIGTGGTGLAFDGSGNVGWYYEGGVGGGGGIRGRIGIQGTVSNANQIRDLEGQFVNVGGGGGEGVDGSVSFGTGTSNYTGQPVATASVSGGAGGGVSGGATVTTTGFFGKINIWDALGFRRRSQNGCK